MDIFQDSEVRWPTRNLQQDEEEQAVSTSDHTPPLLLWNDKARASLFPGGTQPELLVVATCQTSCALLRSCCTADQVIGSVLLADVPLGGNAVAQCLRDRTCYLFGLPGGVVLAVCQYAVPTDQAAAWARALLSDVRPRRVLALGSIQAEQFRGAGEPSQESLLFMMHTAAAAQAHTAGGAASGAAPVVPFLPSGNVVGGLPAALLAHCQARGVAAELLVAVLMVEGQGGDVLQPMARAAAVLIAQGVAGGCAAAVAGLQSPAAVRCARVQLEAAGASSGLLAVFV